MKTWRIRTRLTAMYTALLVLLLFLIYLMIYFFFSRMLYRDAQEQLVRNAGRLAEEIELEDGEVEVDFDDDDIVEIARESLISVYEMDGTLLASNHETAWLKALPQALGVVRNIEEGMHWQVYDRMVRDDGEIIAWVRLATPMEGTVYHLMQLRFIFLCAFPVCVLLSVGSGLWISKRVLAPINSIAVAAQEIGQGDLSKRLNFADTKDEISHLANTFDNMLDSLEEAFCREKQFTSDASHELRTPIAVIMAYAEEALENKQANEASYREALGVIREKGQDMQRMLSQLLMLARGYEREKGVKMLRSNISEIVDDIAREMETRAAEKHISIALDVEPDVHMNIDLMLFTRMLMNIMDNAIQYGKENGHIWMALHQRETEGQRAIELTIRDDGKGISQPDMPHIFERFYQADRARAGTGFGLGLSMVDWIVNLHHGKIEVESCEGQGSCFVLHFAGD